MIGRNVLNFIFYPSFALSAHSLLFVAVRYDQEGIIRDVKELQQRVGVIEVKMQNRKAKKINKK